MSNLRMLKGAGVALTLMTGMHAGAQVVAGGAQLQGQQPQSYVLTQWQRGTQNLNILPQAAPTLQLDGMRATGFSGCNRYSAAYITRAKNKQMRFGDIAGTMMACSPEAMQQESAYTRALSRVTRMEQQGQKLVLIAGKERLMFSPMTDSTVAPTLPIGSWHLQSITIHNVARKSVSTYDPKSSMQFTITPTGAISGNDGCNQFQGQVAINGARLHFTGPVRATRMMCPPQTQSLYDVLGADERSAGATMRLQGERLDLTHPDGQVWHFVRQK